MITDFIGGDYKKMLGKLNKLDKNNMSLKQNDNWNENLRELRAEWLGATKEESILTDDEGKEYILEEVENGTPGEDGYSVDAIKRYLPDNLQSNNFVK